MGMETYGDDGGDDGGGGDGGGGGGAPAAAAASDAGTVARLDGAVGSASRGAALLSTLCIILYCFEGTVLCCRARTVCTFAQLVGVRAGERKCVGRFVFKERTCSARRIGQSVLKLLMVIFLPTLWSFMFLCAFLRGAWQG